MREMRTMPPLGKKSPEVIVDFDDEVLDRRTLLNAY